MSNMENNSADFKAFLESMILDPDETFVPRDTAFVRHREEQSGDTNAIPDVNNDNLGDPTCTDYGRASMFDFLEVPIENVINNAIPREKSLPTIAERLATNCLKALRPDAVTPARYDLSVHPDTLAFLQGATSRLPSGRDSRQLGYHFERASSLAYHSQRASSTTSGREPRDLASLYRALYQDYVRLDFAHDVRAPFHDLPKLDNTINNTIPPRTILSGPTVGRRSAVEYPSSYQVWSVRNQYLAQYLGGLLCAGSGLSPELQPISDSVRIGSPSLTSVKFIAIVEPSHRPHKLPAWDFFFRRSKVETEGPMADQSMPSRRSRTEILNRLRWVIEECRATYNFELQAMISGAHKIVDNFKKQTDKLDGLLREIDIMSEYEQDRGEMSSWQHGS